MPYAISVIIPVYNRSATLHRCLDSVLNQSIKNLEVIIVDDGSTDDSEKIINQYIAKNSNVKSFHSEHCGPGSARNIGIAKATGKYIVFLDSDDWIPVGAYEAMYSYAERESADVVVGQYLRKFDGGKWVEPPLMTEVISSYVGRNCAGEYIIPTKNPSCCNKMVNREFIIANNIHFPAAKMAEDLYYSVSVFKFASKAYVIRDIVYMYETNTDAPSSLITTQSPDIIKDGVDVLKQIGLLFHKEGQVDAQALNLENSFRFILNRFWTLRLTPEKEALFESIKEYLALFVNMSEYQIVIEDLLSMDLNIAIKLPYKTYLRQLELLKKHRSTSQKTLNSTAAISAEQEVLQMFKRGHLGFSYIIRLTKMWLTYKLSAKGTK